MGRMARCLLTVPAYINVQSFISVSHFHINMKYQNSKKMMIMKALLSYPDEICLSMCYHIKGI